MLTTTIFSLYINNLVLLTTNFIRSYAKDSILHYNFQFPNPPFSNELYNIITCAEQCICPHRKIFNQCWTGVHKNVVQCNDSKTSCNTVTHKKSNNVHPMYSRALFPSYINKLILLNRSLYIVIQTITTFTPISTPNPSSPKLNDMRIAMHLFPS